MALDQRLVPVAFVVLAGIFALAALVASSLLLLLIAAVLAVGGSVVHSIERLRADFRVARIAAELGATPAPADPAGPGPAPPAAPEVPRARPYARPPWEKDPERPEGS